MEVSNHYILLRVKDSSYSKTDDDGNITIDLERSVISILKNEIQELQAISKNINEISDDKTDFFKSLYTSKLETPDKSLSVVIYEVNKNSYITVTVKKNTIDDCIEELECFHAVMMSEKMEKTAIVIVSYDAISEYYCNKIYPKLNELERVLRHLFFDIYVLLFNKDYLDLAIDNDLSSKIKSRISSSGGKKNKDISKLKLFFYSLEFSEIQQMLFTPHWTKYDEDRRQKFLEDNDDLSKLSDKELRDFIEAAPKSDWDRFFSEKMGLHPVQELLEEIRKFRNQIAHCKFFYKEDYEKCDEAMSELIMCAKEAISITETTDFYEANFKTFNEMLTGLADRIHELMEPIYKNVDIIIEASKQYAEIMSEATKKFETIRPGICELYNSLQLLVKTSDEENDNSVEISTEK